MQIRPLSSKAPKSKAHASQQQAFDTQLILDAANVSKKVVEYRRSESIYLQGDPATSVLFLQRGSVKLSVTNKVGKEAILAVLGPGEFFGEGCLAGQHLRMGTATATAYSMVLVIDRQEMARALHSERAFADQFMSYILSRNIRVEEDLADQLFNSTEKRLARTLLLLARFGKESQLTTALPKVSQEMLAEMIGATRTRVNFLMNKFRKLGLIEYNGGLQIHSSLLTVVLRDAAPPIR